MRLRAYIVITPGNKLDVIALVNQNRLEAFELSTEMDQQADIVVGLSAHGYDIEKNRGELIKEPDIIKAVMSWLFEASQL